jgi:hypothetical protein
MELTAQNETAPFLRLLDEYEQCFLTRSIDRFRSLHTGDGRLVFFDNHADCDSHSYNDHEAKVAQFFKNGTIVKLKRENVRVFAEGKMACITMSQRYASRPRPRVRTTFVLELEDARWKIRHMHHSFDPNENDEI